MYDSTIHRKTLARHVCKADFAADRNLYNRAALEVAIGRAVTLGLNGFSGVSLRTSTLRGKAVHQLTSLSESLVLRHITTNIRRVTGVRQDDRQFIVRCMRKMLSEGTAFRVYKFDIASFYESVSLKEVFDRLEIDTAFSAQSVLAVRSFFDRLNAAGIGGLPRGIALSATLAEYLLRDFDRQMASTKGVWFYARFVDDIVMITDAREDRSGFKNLTADRLPSGLTFNRKSEIFDFAPYSRNNNAVTEHIFDYLGYRFSTSLAHRGAGHPNQIWRDVWLDIAPAKVRRFKTRVAKSLLAYSKDTDFELLISRLRLLTSNFNFIDLKSGARRTSGVYYNYPLVCADRSAALPELDRYLLNVISSPHPKNQLRPAVTSSQRQQLLNLRFQDGFKNRRFFSFSADRLTHLTACWAYA